MRRFRYLLDPLCLLACLAYALNRWWVAPALDWSFLRNHFNDLLLVPAALPPVLWIQKWAGWRKGNTYPTWLEILGHFAVWSLIAEVLAPRFIERATGDLLDVAAYLSGALAAGIWWQWAALKLDRSEIPPPADFNFLAGHYDWMETVLAGSKLERCRGAFLPFVSHCQDALLVGEGHGKLLVRLARQFPEATITCLDASEEMLRVAERRIRNGGLNADRIRFRLADLYRSQLPAGRHDVIVTQFFLDCFDEKHLPGIITRLSEAARPGAYWLVSDFQIPERGLRRLRAAIIHRLMYAFFRRATGLHAKSATNPAPFLEAAGFTLLHRKEFEWGLLYAELWQLRDPTVPANYQDPT